VASSPHAGPYERGLTVHANHHAKRTSVEWTLDEPREQTVTMRRRPDAMSRPPQTHSPVALAGRSVQVPACSQIERVRNVTPITRSASRWSASSKRRSRRGPVADKECAVIPACRRRAAALRPKATARYRPTGFLAGRRTRCCGRGDVRTGAAPRAAVPRGFSIVAAVSHRCRAGRVSHAPPEAGRRPRSIAATGVGRISSTSRCSLLRAGRRRSSRWTTVQTGTRSRRCALTTPSALRRYAPRPGSAGLGC
jgi:hypothetical protein